MSAYGAQAFQSAQFSQNFQGPVQVTTVPVGVAPASLQYQASAGQMQYPQYHFLQHQSSSGSMPAMTQPGLPAQQVVARYPPQLRNAHAVPSPPHPWHPVAMPPTPAYSPAPSAEMETVTFSTNPASQVLYHPDTQNLQMQPYIQPSQPHAPQGNGQYPANGQYPPVTPAMPPFQTQPFPAHAPAQPPAQQPLVQPLPLRQVSKTGQSMRDAAVQEGVLGGEPVILYDDDKLRKLRLQWAGQLDFRALEGDPQLLDRTQFRGAGGKGGALLRSYNHVFIIKQLSKDDHESLINIAKEYEDYLEAHPESFLTRYFYHFRIKATDELFIIMGDLMPFDSGLKTHELDLKGSADDKYLRADGDKVPAIHKRFYKVHWFVAEGCSCAPLLSPERLRYKALKVKAYSEIFKLPRALCDHVRTVINADALCLQRLRTMDYSVLVAVIEKDASTAPNQFPAGLLPGQPFKVIEGGKEVAYYVGIIDFLQAWTTGKQVAHVIKKLFAPRPISTLEPDAYAEQFIRHNNLRWIPT